MSAADWIGTIGVTLLLIAFGLNLLRVIDSTSYVYLWCNFIGAALAGMASVMINYIPFVVLESVWTLVSLYGLIKRYKEQKRT